ncbi:putative 2-oxoisovalerate dehydrogenase, beta subunit [Operophtera brumata]|uniref:Putative 2-oxoisovalerate dehydrogenase, beta subunit n=1 Tax=Operophtera brumata TaxID=104452 RepID=A0A0L7LSB7_OPEBR|nr:putative 2-oxoisovalerate dehydrogenase, beta subunit [Operophtera brumata]
MDITLKNDPTAVLFGEDVGFGGIVVPRGAITAKGLLLSCIRERDPCLFLEPKILYRSATEEVPVQDYTLPLGKAQVLRQGDAVTLIGWATQIHVLLEVAQMAEQTLGVACEVIDLQTILPWDEETVCSIHVLLEAAQMAQQTLGVACEVSDLQTILPWDEETVCSVSGADGAAEPRRRVRGLRPADHPALGRGDRLQCEYALIGCTQIHVLLEAAQMAQQNLGVACEVSDLQTILPWDEETVCSIHVLLEVAQMAQQTLGVACEVIDLQTILPWDEETVCNPRAARGGAVDPRRRVRCHRPADHPAVGRGDRLQCEYSLIGCTQIHVLLEVAQMAQQTLGVACEEECFLHLEAPIQRVTGWDAPFPHVFEPFYLPDKWRCYHALTQLLKY